MSTTDSTEPTTFALDVYFAAGAQGDQKLAEHVAGCARCSAYLRQLAALAKEPVSLPPTAAQPRKRRSWVAAGAFVSACAAVALWLNTGDNYVGSKGLPAVQALIRSTGQTSVWDGKTPLRSGDAIALRTDCDRFSHVAVAVSAANGGEAKRLKRIFEGSCKEHEPLPFTLVADDHPGNEQIEFVFSRAALADTALQQAIAGRERSDTTWVITLVLPKAGVTR
jgi:hypothetical protein